MGDRRYSRLSRSAHGRGSPCGHREGPEVHRRAPQGFQRRRGDSQTDDRSLTAYETPKRIARSRYFRANQSGGSPRLNMPEIAHRFIETNAFACILVESEETLVS